MNILSKRLLALGASTVVAVSGAYLVEPWEDTKNQAYKDMVGVPTICAGYTIGVKMGDYKTDEECDELLVKELTSFNQEMRKAVKVPLPEHMEVAYTSLVWNIGVTAWNNSSILKKINTNDLQEACKGILVWNKATFSPSAAASQSAKGETCSLKKNGDYACTVKGLTNRRIDEYKVCAGENADVSKALAELDRAKYEPLTVVENAPKQHEAPDGIPTHQSMEITHSDGISEPKCVRKLLGWCWSWV